MPKRVQSPSSINCFKQCPRKYFYQYVLKYPTKENIHCIRGNIVHDALEKFFSFNTIQVDKEQFKTEMATYLKDQFDKSWKAASKRLQKVGLPPDRIDFYFK